MPGTIRTPNPGVVRRLLDIRVTVCPRWSVGVPGGRSPWRGQVFARYPGIRLPTIGLGRAWQNAPMELQRGQTAVVTGAASGIGLALANRFAAAGMNVVLADVEAEPLALAAAQVADRHDVETLAVGCDVRHREQLVALAAQANDRFGDVHVLCNNAGISGSGDAWTGPIEAWDWTFDVNVFGVVHGIRAFLPQMMTSGGYIVNTASVAGLYPGLSPIYDASKHAVVALTENLYRQMRGLGAPVGVSCLCPGWVRTNILDSVRNYPAEYGEPAHSAEYDAVRPIIQRVIDEGMTPAAVADRVAAAITDDRFWIFTDTEFIELAARRWATVAEGINPVLDDPIPGFG